MIQNIKRKGKKRKEQMEERKKLKHPTSTVRPHGERQCHQWELKERNNKASIKNEEKEHKARRVQAIVGNVLRFRVSRRGDKVCRGCSCALAGGATGCFVAWGCYEAGRQFNATATESEQVACEEGAAGAGHAWSATSSALARLWKFS